MLEEAARDLHLDAQIEIKKLWWGAHNRSEMQKQLLNVETNGSTAEPPAQGLEEEIADADYLLSHLGTIPRTVLEKAKKLKLIGTCRGGLEQIDVAAATELGIPVMHVIRNAEATSDFAVGLMFAETRNIARSHAAIRQGSMAQRICKLRLYHLYAGYDSWTCGAGTYWKTGMPKSFWELE